MHPSQPQGTYASPPPMSPMKAMSNPAGTPPPQVRPGSAGMPMEVGSYPNMPHPQPAHQPPGAMGIGQRNMGPRNLQQSRPFMGMSSAPRELPGHMRPNGCPGVGLADPQAIQDRLLPGQQHPGQQPFQQLPTCPPMQPHPGLHHQSSPPHPHHQPWAQLHPSPQNTPQKVPVPQVRELGSCLPCGVKCHAADEGLPVNFVKGISIMKSLSFSLVKLPRNLLFSCYSLYALSY